MFDVSWFLKHDAWGWLCVFVIEWKCSPTGNRQIMRINRCARLLSVFVLVVLVEEEKKKIKDLPVHFQALCFKGQHFNGPKEGEIVRILCVMNDKFHNHWDEQWFVKRGVAENWGSGNRQTSKNPIKKLVGIAEIKIIALESTEKFLTVGKLWRFLYI